MAEDFLAQCLERAAANPARKPEFGVALLVATVWVIGEIEGEDPVKRPQTELKMRHRVLSRNRALAKRIRENAQKNRTALEAVGLLDQQFLNQGAVSSYANIQDAARKLDAMTSPQSSRSRHSTCARTTISRLTIATATDR